jgi:hypothetical protein
MRIIDSQYLYEEHLDFFFYNINKIKLKLICISEIFQEKKEYWGE